MDKLPKKSVGILIILSWVILSIFLTQEVFSALTPKSIDLGDYSCGKATYLKCIEEEIKPRAKNEIKNSIIETLKNGQEIRALFSLPLEIIYFELVLEDKGSKLQLNVSEPKSETTITPKIDLRCNFVGNDISLSTGGKYYSGKYIRLNNLANGTNKDAKKSIEAVANDLADDFNGCSWNPVDKVEYSAPQHQITVAPNATVSMAVVMKPTLVFQPLPSWFRVLTFSVFFAIIGGILALIKQIIEIFRKGLSYFIG